MPDLVMECEAMFAALAYKSIIFAYVYANQLG